MTREEKAVEILGWLQGRSRKLCANVQSGKELLLSAIEIRVAALVVANEIADLLGLDKRLALMGWKGNDQLQQNLDAQVEALMTGREWPRLLKRADVSRTNEGNAPEGEQS